MRNLPSTKLGTVWVWTGTTVMICEPLSIRSASLTSHGEVVEWVLHVVHRLLLEAEVGAIIPQHEVPPPPVLYVLSWKNNAT